MAHFLWGGELGWVMTLGGGVGRRNFNPSFFLGYRGGHLNSSNPHFTDSSCHVLSEDLLPISVKSHPDSTEMSHMSV